MAKTNSPADIRERLVHYAEQLGSLAGTVKGNADGLLDHAALAQHLEGIRDGAADLLKHLAPSAAKKKTAAPPKASAKAPARDPHVGAPGKKHRAPAESARGVKHSDQRIPKLKTATMKGRHTSRRG